MNTETLRSEERDDILPDIFIMSISGNTVFEDHTTNSTKEVYLPSGGLQHSLALGGGGNKETTFCLIHICLR